MAPPVEQGKPGWLKLATACYYCLASMTVQFMNKVICHGNIDIILRHICDLWKAAERMYGQRR